MSLVLIVFGFFFPPRCWQTCINNSLGCSARVGQLEEGENVAACSGQSYTCSPVYLHMSQKPGFKIVGAIHAACFSKNV